MPNETAIDVVSQLDSLLAKEGLGVSKARAILATLQEDLKPPSEELEESSDYTKSRAHALRTLAVRMKAHLASSRQNEFTYADKAVSLAAVSDAYLKLTHAFKTDPKMWTLAQTELVPMLTQVSDEEGIDAALVVLESHLDTYLVSLDSWLEK